jgi:leader peptidase (prepilin peptidase)/N-methyltransferase
VIAGSLIGGPGQQIVLSLALLAAVADSLLAAPGPDGLFGAFLGALILAIAIIDSARYVIPNELTGAALALALLRAAVVGPEADSRALIWAPFRAAAIAVPLLALMIGYRRCREAATDPASAMSSSRRSQARGSASSQSLR